MTASETLDAERCARAVLHLRDGGVVAAATESFFALMVDPSRPAALDTLFRIKQRDEMQGVALLLDRTEHWLQWVCAVPASAQALAERYWPGPLTIALPALAHVDRRLTVAGSLGVRIPGRSAALDVVRAFGGALTATSANVSGQPAARTAADVSACLGHVPDLMVLPGRGLGLAPSTIVSYVPETDRVAVVRDGAIDPVELVAALAAVPRLDPTLQRH